MQQHTSVDEESAAGDEKSRKKRLFISSASLLFIPKPKRINHTAENQSNYAMHCTLVYFQAIFPTKTINLATLKDPAHSHTLKKKKKKNPTVLQCRAEHLHNRTLWVEVHYDMATAG